jgi:hypothetical protein
MSHKRKSADTDIHGKLDEIVTIIKREETEKYLLEMEKYKSRAQAYAVSERFTRYLADKIREKEISNNDDGFRKFLVDIQAVLDAHRVEKNKRYDDEEDDKKGDEDYTRISTQADELAGPLV